ncbi:hypothetical protein CMV_007763 [Castanea mollissima]|uniref:Uncharacterized protein n=1 Tax=Castanea mollissima TaxID=60419 RepID=A0A8J4VPX4_9ROSI|nr:hypothetical protein CMV_007763 [Castanea mollissima]
MQKRDNGRRAQDFSHPKHQVWFRLTFRDPEVLFNMEECKAWEAPAIKDQDIVNTLTSLVGLAQETIPALPVFEIPNCPYYLWSSCTVCYNPLGANTASSIVGYQNN